MEREDTWIRRYQAEVTGPVGEAEIVSAEVTVDEVVRRKEEKGWKGASAEEGSNNGRHSAMETGEEIRIEGKHSSRPEQGEKEIPRSRRPFPKRTQSSLAVTIRVPPKHEKEVDSDGDTVCGYSDEDSPLTPLSSASESSGSALSQLRLPTNNYLARIVNRPVDRITHTPRGEQVITELSADSESQDSSPIRRKRRPPPKAHIVRVPKHRRCMITLDSPGSITHTSSYPTGRTPQGHKTHSSPISQHNLPPRQSV